jgi:hypothetical protein
MTALPGLCLALLAPGPTADVWEVGGGGAATIDAAIALASEGDVILVHAGTYPGFTVTAKSLVITADEGENVFVHGSALVQGLGAGQSLTLQGLRAQASGYFALHASACAGALWIEDCEVEGYESVSSGYPGGEALTAQDCASVVLRRSTFVGGFGGLISGGPGGDAVVLHASNVAMFSCSVEGGYGGFGGYDWIFGCSGENGAPGGDGIVTELGELFFQASTVTGGDGGLGDFCSASSGCGEGGNGGTGLVCSGPTTMVQSSLFGGAGAPDAHICGGGDPGQPVKHLGGTLAQLPLTATALAAASPLREGELAQAVASGEPFQLLAVYASFAPALVELPGAAGFQLLAPAVVLFGAAVLPASGELTIAGHVPDLGASVQGLTLRLQAVGLSSSGGFMLGEPATLVLLDSAL